MPEGAATHAGNTTDSLLACGNCRQSMRRLHLAGHYAQTVELDLCGGCHLIWFDQVESARLGGPGVLALIGHMARTHALAHATLSPRAGCSRCHGALKTVHNQSRWGRSLQLECANRHGAYQTFAQFLFEKGLVRPMSSADRAALLKRDGRIACVNCGGALEGGDAACSYCGSVPSLVDVARLARALDPEGALTPQPLHQSAARTEALQCMACGAAVPPGQAVQCAQCGATLAVSRLAQAYEQLSTLRPALEAHARKPAPDVVRRRVQALAADVPQRREWVRDMEAGTSPGTEPDEGVDFLSLLSPRTNPLRAVFIALVVWWLWWYW